MKRSLKIFLYSLLALILILAVGIGSLYLYSSNYSIPEQEPSIVNTTGLVQVHGRSLYDPEGNPLQLQGINAGQILLQEGWMSPFALEPLKNEDGSYIKDKDGNLTYPEFTEEEFRAGLLANPNLKDRNIEEMMAYYRSCIFTEEDFRIIRQELGLNTIRLPFYYLNVMHEDLTLKDEAEAFSYLDWFLEEAAKNELYVVLDLHGAPGSQNGYEHSGAAERAAKLWDSEENIAATVELWRFVANHYTQTRPDLGRWIATYDILNEPTAEYKSVTTRICWDVFDLIYEAIRGEGDAHVITMEGCWDFSSLPDPAEYGWENIQYSYHWYNWWPDILPYEVFYMYQDLFNLGRDYDVPVLIGEFTCFENKDHWEKELTMFDARNYSWTIWNYKTTVTGWWTSSWGVYTCQMNLDTATEETKCNVSTCTYEEFIAACDLTRTENCATGTLYDVIRAHTGK